MKWVWALLFLFCSFLYSTGFGQGGESICIAYPSDASLIYLGQNNPNLGIIPVINNRRAIPVKIHVIRTNAGLGGPSLSLIHSSIDNLNTAFQGANVEFYQYGIVNYINDDQYFEFYSNFDVHQIASEYAISGVINLFIPNTIIGGIISEDANCNYNSTAGFAFFPEDFNAPYLDCVFMTTGALNDNTLIHEMGHYFGLYHTHGKYNASTEENITCPGENISGNCDGFTKEVWLKGAVQFDQSSSDINSDGIPDNAQTGDDVADTPAEPVAPILGIEEISTSEIQTCYYQNEQWDFFLDTDNDGTHFNEVGQNCLVGGKSPDIPLDPFGQQYNLGVINNFMSYAFPRSCLTTPRGIFTEGQYNRIKYFLVNKRFYLKDFFLGPISAIPACQNDYSILWYANEGFAGQVIKVEASIDGAPWCAIGEQTAQIGENLTNWSVPNIASNNVKIRIYPVGDLSSIDIANDITVFENGVYNCVDTWICEVPGCTDPQAHNFDPQANTNDGSCQTCFDAIQNGDETGIDCGGSLCAPCTQYPFEFTWPSGPNQCFEPGDQVTITWVSSGNAPYVRLEYCFLGGSCTTIHPNAPNVGAYNWTVGAAQGNGNYYLKIFNFFNPAINHTSEIFQVLTDCTPEVSGCTNPNAHNHNANATVDDGSCQTCEDGMQNGDETGVDCGGNLCPPCASPGSLAVTWPSAAGNCYEVGNQQTISWDADGNIPTVHLEYCKVLPGNDDCEVIQLFVPNNNGLNTYGWTVSTPLGEGEYYIKVYNPDNTSTNDSGNTFSIMNDCGGGIAFMTISPQQSCYEYGNSVTLEWNLPQPEITQLRRCVVGGGCTGITLVPRSGSRVETIPNTAGDYYYEVYQNATGDAAQSPEFEVSGNCSDGACDPVVVTLNQPTDNANFDVGATVNFSWQHNGPPIGPCAPQSYQMQFDNSSDFSSPNEVGPLFSNSFSFTYNSPTVRHWRVRIFNNDGEYGPWSASQRFIIQDNAPPDGLPLELAANLTYPSPFCRLQEATVTASIHNPNNTTWTGELGAALLTPNNLDESQFIERKFNQTLVAGQTKILTFTGLVTINTASPILAISKKDNNSENTLLVEDGAGNNAITVSVQTCTGSEYVEGDFTILNETIDEANSMLFPGGEIQVSCEQKWHGISSQILRPYVGYFLSTDAVWSGNDIYLGRDRSALFGCSISPCGDDEYEEATLNIPTYLEPGTYYLIFVADYDDAYDETNEGNNVERESFVLAPGGSASCPSPNSLNYHSLTTTSVALDWSTVAEAAAYEVEWGISGGSANLEYSMTTSMSLYNLNTATQYCYRVRSICPEGTGSFSTQVCFTTEEDSTPCTEVTNTNLSGPGSLREAIDCANANVGPDLISFNIPGSGPHIIQMNTSLLPTLSDAATTIDATTQPGYYLGIIELKAPHQNFAYGLQVRSDNAEIYGLKITSFGTGIRVPANTPITATIGGAGKGNYLLTNLTGIFALANSTGQDPTVIIKGNTIEGYGLGRGINVQSSGNTIGGANTGEGNIIFNYNEGVCNCSSIATNNIIRGNSIHCTNTGIYFSNGTAPSINNASPSTIAGTSTPNTVIDVYISDNSDCPSNTVCLGKIYLGHTTSNSSGGWTLNGPFNALITDGDMVTATATRNGFSTSNFSACQTVEGVQILECTTLASPTNNATEVNIDADLSWTAVAGATGYYLTAGTSSGGTDLLDAVDVGNTTSYDPGTFEYLTTIFVTLTPYSDATMAMDCEERRFTTQSPPCLNTEVSIGAAGIYELQSDDVFDESTYNHLTVNNFSPALINCTDVGNLVPVSVTLTNAYNIQGSCTASISSVDGISPDISCPDSQQLRLDENCEGILGDYTTFASTTDNCDQNLLVSQHPVAGSLVGGVGPSTITLVAQDDAGNSNSCTFSIEKIDDLPPVAQCQTSTVYLDPNGNYALQAADVLDQNNSADNCSAVSIVSTSVGLVDCFNEGSTLPVLVSVADEAGNLSNCTAIISVEQGTALPSPWDHSAIGGAVGNATYAPCEGPDGTFTVSSNGFSIPNNDKTYTAFHEICGDLEITVHISGLDPGGWAGIMLRDGMGSGAKKISLKTQLSTFVRRDIRVSENGTQQTQQLFRPNVSWLRIARYNQVFLGYTSINGSDWQPAFTATVPMGECLEVGLFVESPNVNTTITADFDQVNIMGGGNALAALPSIVDITEKEEGLVLEVFPNPTQGEVQLDIHQAEEEHLFLQVFNSQGQLIIRKEFARQSRVRDRLDLGRFSPGLYLIRVQTGDMRMRSQRVIVD